MRKLLVILLITLHVALIPLRGSLAAQASPARVPPQYAERLRLFEEFVRQQMAKDKIPGLTIGFVKGDYVWVKGFGYADLENKVPATAESAYRLASVTKPVTASAILQLVEKGKIGLDAEVQAYVPYYPKQKWPVTVRQLLGHLGGGQSGSGLGPERKTVREVIEAIAKKELFAEPGTKFLYTTSGYNLLGAAIEGASGQGFGEYLRKNIFLPLGMNKTRLDDGGEPVPNRVRSYTFVNGAIKEARFVDVSTRFGGGGLIGTVPDMLRFAKALNSGQVLSKETLKLMYSPMVNREGRAEAPPAGADSGYGMGWFVSPVNGRFHAEHGGLQVGTETDLFVLPSEDFAIAFACNVDDSSGPFLYSPYVWRLYELIFDERWVMPVYTKDKVDAALINSMWSVFDHGGSFFDKNRQPLSTNPQELASSFAYFNRSVNRNAIETAYADTMKAIDNGRHPVAGQAFVKVGSYMADKLLERYGAQHFDTYHKRGAIDFFGDYIKLYRGSPRVPKEERFDQPFEQTVLKWQQDWKRTWNEETRHLTISPESDLTRIGALLRRTFAGAELIPNFTGSLLGTANRLFFKGELEKALQAATLAAELYPQNESTNFALAIHLLSVGDQTRARAALKKSITINAGGIASASRLKQNALGLAGAGKLNEAVGLLTLGVELYPKEASLYDALGELFLKRGDKAKAIEAYRKALEIDPGFEHAKEMLKKLSP